jgi:hypothetical protein
MRRPLHTRSHHHQLNFAGPAPWPVPAVLDLQEVQRDPGARCCRECGRRLLLLLLKSHTWVSRRVEHVSFRDDRSVVRSVTAEFYVPDEAPIFRGDDGQYYSFVPLSVMRRKTLVNFEVRDQEGRPVAMPTLRQNQAITESLLLACADAVAGGNSDHSVARRREIEDFVHRVISGDQQELVDTYDSLESSREPAAVLELYDNKAFRAILDRMADNFVLWAMIPANGPRRRVLTFSCDEPLYLHYQSSGHKKGNNGTAEDVDTYGMVKKLGVWRFTVWAAALGLRPTVIQFPVPAAENAASFHFEIDAPKGLQIVEASLLAGRPGREKPSFDHMKGNLPTVGLHVIEVPNGSRSRAQVGLQVANRGWLVTSLASCAAVFGLLIAFAVHSNVLERAGELPVLILIALAAAAAGFVAQSDVHPLAAYLLQWTRSLAFIAAILPLVAIIFIVFGGTAPTQVAPALWSAAAVSGAITLLLAVVCFSSWLRQGKSVRSPWEQDHRNREFELPPKEFDAAEEKYHYTKPAMQVDSAEGWHRGSRLTEKFEQELINALSRPFNHVRLNANDHPLWEAFRGRRPNSLPNAPAGPPVSVRRWCRS